MDGGDSMVTTKSAAERLERPMAATIRPPVPRLGVRDGARSAPVGGWIKRVFDIVFALVALTTFASLILVIALAIRWRTGGPAFFVHHRVGFRGARVPCLKFRTMRVDAEARLAELLRSDPVARARFAHNQKLENDPRIIPGIGHFLRRSSLDELPQFLNVLAGHMSVVGPRPVTREEVALYGAAAQKYLSARPGITGLWQVSGRSRTSYARRVELDRTYVDTWSLGADLAIIWRTIFVLTDGA